MLFTSFAVISAAGILRAWTVEGTVRDRRTELARLQEQLLEQQARGEQLEQRLSAFDSRTDVRMQTIRAELGMLREGERFYVFR